MITHRGINIHSKKWEFGLFSLTNQSEYAISEHQEGVIFMHRIIPKTLSRFTGLEVKNGELCEGDIFKYTQHERYVEKSFIAKVVWSETYGCWGYIKKDAVFDNIIAFYSHDELFDDILIHCEILGDIYNNKEYFN